MSYKKLKKSKYHLLITILPLTLLVVLIKIAFHYLGWEPMPKEFIPFFPSVLTGIIFLLGIVLAGVVSDYKESERIPNDIASSLYIIWQESEIITKNYGHEAAKNLFEKLKRFVPILKNDFFIERNKNIFQLIDSFSDDFANLDSKGIAPAFMARLRNEQVNIRKLLNRINIIRDTDFAPSLIAIIKLIIIVFLIIYFLLNIDPVWGGVLFVWFFTFVLFSIIYLIQDMEDPFEYEKDVEKADEINLIILEQFHEEINKN